MPLNSVLRIGTRGSRLALCQARWVAGELGRRCPDVDVDVTIVKTTGDRVQDKPLSELGVRGAFTKELDRALLDGRVDMAVHSLKDVPTQDVPGIVLVAVTKREDPRDAFVGRETGSIEELPEGAVVGTGSLRRRAQLLRMRPDLQVVPVRGNIDTRLSKLRDTNTLGGILLAMAGVIRLGIEDQTIRPLDVPGWLPAPGQGALAIAARCDDDALLAASGHLDDPAARIATTSERAMLAGLAGGCSVPIGAFGRIEDGSLALDGFVASPDGAVFVRDRVAGPPERPAELGKALADRLVAQGGGDILAALEMESERNHD